MAYREMTAIEIAKRIGQGDLVVYVDEEYGYRYWFWFPNMSEDELTAYWEKCNIEDHFFNPSELPGDMVPIPAENIDEDDVDSYYERAYADPRWIGLNRHMRGGTETERVEMIAAYDEWRKEWFPNEAMWHIGCNSDSTWRAHTHMEDDSWLKKPNE